MFCILLVAGEVSAQKHRWEVFPTPGMSPMMGTWYVDLESIRQLPNGNVVFWSKGGGRVTQTEVNCVAKEYRTLKAIESAKTDSYGNQTNAETDVTYKSGTEWRAATPTSISDKMNGVICQVSKSKAFRSYSSDTQKKAIKKKTVKKVMKRKT
jgi:hypothetical protein